MLTVTLLLLVIISATIHIRAEYRGPRQQIYIFKPLTMLLIGLMAILGQGAPPFYKYLILIGFLFSLMGDIFLMLPSDRFVSGLVAFLIAHLFYIGAFVPEIGAFRWWPLIPFALFGIAIFIYLAPSLGKLKLPVFLYVAVIMVMAWFAWERWIETGQRGALWAAFGAVLFVVSDTILALNRFGAPFKSARFLNLATYFSAQWLIAGSIGSLGF